MASTFGCGSVPAPAASGAPAIAPSISPTFVDVTEQLDGLEVEFDARVGVSALDTGTGRTVAYRGDERFGYASTLKAFAAAEFLRRVPSADRDVIVTWTQTDLDSAGYSPVTTEYLAQGLPLLELAEAAVRASDNTAMNLILERLGGPPALDAGLEALGDEVTEVVDYEPDLNIVEANTIDDTSTPAAFTGDLRALFDDRLTAHDQRVLVEFMSGNATGDDLIRAGAPDGWTVADKSGGAGAVRNDIAIVTPPDREPILISIFTTKNDAAEEYEDLLIAETATVVLNALS